MFLVHFLNHTKKCLKPTEESIRYLFQIGPKNQIFIQHFDVEFNCYIDISWEELSCLEKGKLKVCLDNDKLHLIEGPKENSTFIDIGNIDSEPPKSNHPKQLNYRDNPRPSQHYVILTDRGPSRKEASHVTDDDIEIKFVKEEVDFFQLEKDEFNQRHVPYSEPICEVDGHVTKESLSEFNQLENDLNKKPEKDNNASIGAQKEKSEMTKVLKDVVPVMATSKSYKPSGTLNLSLNFKCDMTTKSCIAGASSVQQHNLNKYCHYNNLPTSYQLPFIDPNSKLGKALASKKKLNKSETGKFLNTIYNSYTSKNMYYIGNQYTNIVNAILNSFPHLGMGLPYESAKHFLKRKLYTKFNNEHSRGDAREEVVIQNKRSRLDHLKKGSVNKFTLSFGDWYGIPNYDPHVQVDDEAQTKVESQKRWMINEFKKVVREESLIRASMDLTFPSRRGFILNQTGNMPKTSLDILKMYPCLGIEEQAILEIERLFGTSKHYERYSKYIINFSCLVSEEIAKSKSKNKSYYNGLIDNCCHLSLEDQKLIIVLAGVSVLTQEDPSLVIGTDINDGPSPMLKIGEEGSVCLMMHGVTIIRNIRPQNAAYIWLGSFMIFNESVAASIKRTYRMLTHLFFQHPQHPKFTPTCMVILALWQQMVALQPY